MKRGDKAKIIRSEAGNEGRIVTLINHLVNDRWAVKGDLNKICPDIGEIRKTTWGIFHASQLEPVTP